MVDVSVRPPRRIGPLVVLLVAAAFLALIVLGSWQMQRLFWKEALITTIAERMTGTPVALEEVVAIEAAGGDIEYRRVRLTGRFLHEGEQFFFATYNGRSGYFVYTPFELADTSVIFVNRGFVDVDAKDPARREDGQIEGEVTVTGLARDRLAAKPSWLVPDNDPARDIFFWKDLDAMAANAGVAEGTAPIIDFFVDADATPNPGGLPIGGVTIIDLPNTHLQYAITWYGLALALAGVVAAVLLKRRNPA